MEVLQKICYTLPTSVRQENEKKNNIYIKKTSTIKNMNKNLKFRKSPK